MYLLCEDTKSKGNADPTSVEKDSEEMGLEWKEERERERDEAEASHGLEHAWELLQMLRFA